MCWSRAIWRPVARACRLEQFAFARLDPLGRAQHAFLVLLECRRDKALARRNRLPPLIVRRNGREVRVGDLDVVPEHFVESNLERRDSSACSFLGLNARDRVAPTVAETAQVVEVGVDSGRDCRLVANRERRSLDERRTDLRREFRGIVPLRENFAEAPRIIRNAMEGGGNSRQRRERIAERAKLTRSAASRCRFRREPFDVSHVVDRVAHRFARDDVGAQRPDGIEPRVDSRT